MHKGLSVARGEWVLFAHADVHIERGTIERLIAYAERKGVDFMGVFPKIERVSLPVDASLAGLLRGLCFGGRLWKINDDRSGIGGGVGAFNLSKREWLEHTGAIEHLRMSSIALAMDSASYPSETPRSTRSNIAGAITRNPSRA